MSLSLGGRENKRAWRPLMATTCSSPPRRKMLCFLGLCTPICDILFPLPRRDWTAEGRDIALTTCFIQGFSPPHHVSPNARHFPGRVMTLTFMFMFIAILICSLPPPAGVADAGAVAVIFIDMSISASERTNFPFDGST